MRTTFGLLTLTGLWLMARPCLAVNNLSIRPAQGWPGGPAFIAVQTDGLENLGQAYLNLSSPAIDMVNRDRNPYLFPLSFVTSDGGPAAWKAWPELDQTGQIAKLDLGRPGFHGEVDPPYSSPNPEVLNWYLVRIAANAPVGSQYPVSLDYSLVDQNQDGLSSGTAPGTVTVVPPPAAAPAGGTPALRLGTYRVPPGAIFRVYLQAGPSFQGVWLYYDLALPAGLKAINGGGSGYYNGSWHMRPLDRYLSENSIVRNTPDPRFPGLIFLDATAHAIGLDKDPRPLVAPPVLWRAYFQVPADAPAGTTYTLGVSAYAIPQDLSTLMPLPTQDGQVIVDPSVSFVPGDLNGDGKVTTADATVALRIAVGLVTPSPEQMDQLLQTADLAPVDSCLSPWYAVQVACGSNGPPPLSRGDGKITVADAVKVLRLAVGLPLDVPPMPADTGQGTGP